MTYSDFDLLQAYIYHHASGPYDDHQVGDWITAQGGSSRYARPTQVMAVDGALITLRMLHDDGVWRSRATTRAEVKQSKMLVPKLFTTVIPD